MSKKNEHTLPLNTLVELVGVKGDLVRKKTMTYEEALARFTKGAKGWNLSIYQVGFCTMKETTKK